MNDTKPGTMADFKQRREAYRLQGELHDRGVDAKAALDAGFPKAASEELRPVLSAVDKNPHAARVVEARAPGMLHAARELYAEAKAAAPYEVTRTRSAGALSDGYTETQLEFGRSDKGHHYRLHRSTYNSENDAQWSRPLPSERAAHAAGHAAQDRWLGEDRQRPDRDPSRAAERTRARGMERER